MNETQTTWTPTPENIEALFENLAHGDEQHRHWLRERLYAYFGQSVPAKVSE